MFHPYSSVRLLDSMGEKIVAAFYVTRKILQQQVHRKNVLTSDITQVNAITLKHNKYSDSMHLIS